MSLEGLGSWVNTYYNLEYTLDSMEEEFYYLFLTHDYTSYWVNKFRDVLEKLEEEVSMKQFLSILLYYLFSNSIKFNSLTIQTYSSVLLYFVLGNINFSFASPTVAENPDLLRSLC
ncbi:Hypothetical protein SSO2959 [Saccharolobus solfataricus P2]|uniref:Uncharacterized protein n=2 Tax=Saccharolobus solfataricus TaxID=2287 RepID=Q97UP5_SACS2|nr:Hypothetical protein SSO2959 [Saccharolobus solfataricus P2]SAI86612.1 uncharacterised protein [Saccharolobus solfataricus]